MASTTVSNVSYPRGVGVNLRLTFECNIKEDEEYLIQTPPGIEPEEVQLGFIADLFDSWSDNLPTLVEINGWSRAQIKQHMLGKIL